LTVPLTAFNNFMPQEWSHILGAITTAFWTLDLFASFLTGFYTGGVVEMRPKKIAIRYIRTWFPLDFLIVFADFLLYLSESDLADFIGVIRVMKAVRLSRLLRMLRLFRVLKIPKKLDDLASNVQSETLSTAISIGRSLGLILVINHFIACGWYAVSMMVESKYPRWVTNLEQERRTVAYMYLTSLHWSLTQFTPASMEVVPRNEMERLYAIFVLFSALVTFSTFVSSITTAMTNLRRVNAERSQQKAFIDRYIAENHLSVELGNKISAFAKSYNVKRRRVHKDDVQVFRMLSPNLQLQLNCEVYSTKLIAHPVCFHIMEIDKPCLEEFCNRAMSEVSVATEHDLFTYGATATKVYFMQGGLMQYRHSARDIGVLDKFDATGPDSHRWFCEVVLWVKWEHRGRLVAAWPSDFVALRDDMFRKILSQRPALLTGCRNYASAFRKRMLDKPDDFHWDVWADFDEIQEMTHTAFGDLGDMENVSSTQGPKSLLKVWRTWSPRIMGRGKPAAGMIGIRSNTL